MTDISALEAYAGQLSEAASRSNAASVKNHAYIHTDDQSDVDTESGPVPSIAKQARLSREKTAVLETDLAHPSDVARGAAKIARGIQVVSSIAALRALKKNTPSKNASVVGYYVPGDGGGGDYYLDVTDTTSADDGGVVIVAADGGRWKYVMSQTLTFRTWGAKGDGLSPIEDTIAIDKALAYSYNTARSTHGLMGWGWQQVNIFPSPGHYIYSGAGSDVPSTRSFILTAVPNTVTITITSDVYLINCKGLVLNTYVSGVNTIGGKGMIRQEGVATNVTGHHVFKNFRCDDYSVCAISNESVDQPYFKFKNLQLMGKATGGTIGIAIGGYLDGSHFEDIEFLRNKYHLKMGPRLSGNALVERCDFISWTPGFVEADVWFVPNAETVASSGQGIVFTDNKFGPENVSTINPRFLIADELPGDSRGSRHHSTANSVGHVSGFSIIQNQIASASGVMTAPMIRSYTPNFRGLHFGPNEYFGSPWTYLCEFMCPELVDSSSDYTIKTWDIDLAGANTNGILGTPPFARLTNHKMGIARSPHGVMLTAPETMLTNNSLGDDAKYKPLARMPDTSVISVSPGASKEPILDVYGKSNKAARVTLIAAQVAHNANVTFNSANVTQGQMAWVELDLKKSDVRGLASVLVRVASYATNGVALSRRIYLESSWETIRIPFIFPKTASLSTWQLTVSAESVHFVAGVTDTFDVGRKFVYHGKQPVNTGHLMSLGSGAWDGAHIVMGTWHIWVTAAGVWRKKNGDPTSENDGTVFGA